MANIGEYNLLEIVRKADHGLYLAGEGENDILLPNVYIPDEYKIGDEIKVFVYRDSEDRIIATSLEPKAIVGDFAYLKVISATAVGAFLDWGLPKDLLVPFKEQQTRMHSGQSYVVYVYLDEETDRLVATSKFNRFISDEKPELTVGQEVDLMVYKETDLGFKALVNNRYNGMIFNNEIFQAIHIGKQLKGYVKQIRPDYKIDLVLQKGGFENIDPVAEKILEYLKSNEGAMDITDKSPAELIYAKFGISKRAFKQAIGQLYKKRLISLKQDSISLVSDIN